MQKNNILFIFLYSQKMNIKLKKQMLLKKNP